MITSELLRCLLPGAVLVHTNFRTDKMYCYTLLREPKMTMSEGSPVRYIELLTISPGWVFNVNGRSEVESPRISRLWFLPEDYHDVAWDIVCNTG